MATLTTSPADLSPEAWQFLERRVAEFEKAWNTGERPQIEAFCPKDPAGDPTEGWLLPELVHAELEFRIEAGEPARVEEYIERFPSLTRQADTIADLIESEFRARQVLEPQLSPEEYRDRFPQYVECLIGRASASDVTDRDDAFETPTAPPKRPTVPGFEIRKLLGRGGMGVVYEALDSRLNRLVAIKVLHGGSDACEQKRLIHEARSAAALQHPHVVQVYQTGSFDGDAFVVMELLSGGSLAERINGSPLRTEEAASLMETVARVVGFAHSRGLIHRDLKPSNVVFTADGIAKIADFGLAKRFDDALLTQSGTLAGSPSYMAPEQAMGDTDVGPAADIWALGTMLYEMLAGRPPFRGATVLDTLELVRRSEPVPLRRLVPRLSKDLETICLKCLEKQPAKRYLAAEDLADDLQRFQRGQAIHARPVGLLERGRRWTSRNRSVSALLALLVLSLVGGTSASLWYAARSNENARSSAQHLHASRLSEEKATRLAAEAELRSHEAQRFAAEAKAQERHARQLLLASDMRRALDAFVARDPRQAAELVDAHLEDPLAHSFVLNSLNRFARSPSREVFRSGEPIYFVSFSPNGSLLAACGADGRIRIFETLTWSLAGTIEAGQGELNGLTFSADGKRLASAGDDGTVVLWELSTGARVWKAPVFAKQAFEVVFGLGDRVLAVCGHDPQIRLLHADTGCIVGVLDGHDRTVESISVTPDGKTLASSSADRKCAIWDLERRRKKWPVREQGSWGLKDATISPDGRWAAFGSGRSIVWIEDLATGSTIVHGPVQSQRSPGEFGSSARALAFFGPDRDLLVSADARHLERVRVVEGELVPIPNSPRSIWAVARKRTRSLATHGEMIVSASDDGVIDLWEPTKSPAWRRHHVPDINDLTWVRRSDGEEQIAIVSPRGLFVVAPDRGTMEQCDSSPQNAIGASSDGKTFLSMSSKGTLTCWNTSAAIPQAAWRRHRSQTLRDVTNWDQPQVSELNAALLTVNHTNSVFFTLVEATNSRSKEERECCALMKFDGRTGEPRRRRELPLESLIQLAIAADGETAAIAPLSEQGEISLIDTADLKELTRFVAHPIDVHALAFSPVAPVLATTGDDAAIRLWNDGRLVREWRSGTSLVHDLAFSSDGRLLVSASRDQPPRVWDVETGRLQLDFSRLLEFESNGKHDSVKVAFSLDGARVAVGKRDSLLILEGRPLTEE